MWISPKTDWGRESIFDKDDYNRIKNNLNYLKELVNKLYKDFDYTNMGADRGYFDFIYAEDINDIENNLENICSASFNPNIGSKKTYYANQLFINFEELNRIESASLLLYENLKSQDIGRKKLAFNLGGGFFNAIKNRLCR